ncbi:Hypothetical predicted protein [Octopus vulgaris]|uniref:Uncharacterized protein n=1 Tax=Octopus vulgaris TaxID=6645 RepID=A0AA36BG34_OCTVU|nr:Hypothetical predicted protein [Octopus vulgaris]
MASIKTCENSIAVLSGKQIKLFDIRQGNITTFCLPEEPPKVEKSQEEDKQIREVIKFDINSINVELRCAIDKSPYAVAVSHRIGSPYLLNPQ